MAAARPGHPPCRLKIGIVICRCPVGGRHKTVHDEFGRALEVLESVQEAARRPIWDTGQAVQRGPKASQSG